MGKPPAMMRPGLAGLDGYWRADGYSTILEIHEGRFRSWEVTRVSCLPATPGWLEPESIPIDAGLLGDKLVINHRVAASFRTASRIEALPPACIQGETQPSPDPELSFEVFWHTFAENSPFFDLYEVDWQRQYARFRPQVGTKTSDDELFAIFCQMVEPFRDRHTSVSTSGDRRYSPGRYPPWLDLSQMQRATTLIRQRMAEGVPPSGEFSWLAFGNFLAVIRDNYLHRAVTEAYHRLIFYGRLGERVGYMNILRIMNYDNDPAEPEEPLAAAIDQVLAALEDVDTLILDIRFNPGGWDRNSLLIASRFADCRRLALSKQAWERGGFSPRQDVYVEPAGARRFTRRVILLTSGYTCSGAEILTMALTALPHVTVIGEKTAGNHSDTFGRRLPNGWSFSLSNEVYQVHGKTCYEGVGLPPHEELPLDRRGFEAGYDNILERALQMAGEER